MHSGHTGGPGWGGGGGGLNSLFNKNIDINSVFGKYEVNTIYSIKCEFAKKCSWGLKTEKKKLGGFPYNFFFQKCSWGSESGGGGGFWGVWGTTRPHLWVARGSKNDTLLPMTMTRDRPKFWNSPACRSKVIIRKPWRWKNKKQEKK